jgi:hypothetical protein
VELLRGRSTECWTLVARALGHLAAGNDAQKAAIVAAGVFPLLLQELMTSGPEMRRSARQPLYG